MTRHFKFRLCIFFVWVSASSIQSGPIDRYTRVIREVYPEIEPEKVDVAQQQVCVVGDVVYGAEESVPADQPCLKCKCQPPGVHCETIRCPQKPGCKAIHKPNECCPEYQCECEFEGKMYANGERLETKPGDECQVCYCRRGEVQCTDVSCYIRTDCEGRTVPGQCCPKYEHCPPIELAQEKPKLDPQEIIPTFISTTQSSQFTGNTSSENEITDTTEVLKKYRTTPLVTVTSEETTSRITNVEEADEQNEEPKITIHEVIPLVKEVPVTEVPKVDTSPKIELIKEKMDGSNQENLVDTANSELPDSQNDQSELSEVFQPPPVIKIGDKILYLKRDEIDFIEQPNNSSVFTVVGAEGLERGDTDPVETIKEAIPEEQSQENLDKTTTDNPSSTSPNINQVSNKQEGSTTEVIRFDNYTIDIAVELPESQDIDAESSENEPSIVSTPTNEVKPIKTEDKGRIDDVVQLENPAYPPIPEIMIQQDAEYVEHHEHLQHSDVEHLHTEQKLSEQSENLKIQEELKTSVEDSPNITDSSKILPEILEVRNNNTVQQNATNLAWLKEEEPQLINEDAILPEEILRQIAASDLDETTDTNSLTTLENLPSTEPTTEALQSSEMIHFGGDDLLRQSSVIESESVSENHIKKLTDDDDITGTSSSAMTQEEPQLKSVESLERTSRESGENTTPKGVIDSSNDASVEGVSQDSLELMSSEENTSKSVYPKELQKDVEMINPSLLSKNATSVRNITHEESSKEMKQPKVISDSDKIFEELDKELRLLSGEYISSEPTIKDKEEEVMIFKELLDEIHSPPTRNPKGSTKSKDGDHLQKLTDALANIRLKDARQSLDLGVIGVLRDFFTAQYKSYKK